MTTHAPYTPGDREDDLQGWMDLVVRFLDGGESMEAAMTHASRTIALTRTQRREPPRRAGSGTYRKAETRDTLPSPSLAEGASRSR